MKKYFKMLAMFILLLNIMILPGSAFATGNNEIFIEVYDYTEIDLNGFFLLPTDEITIHENQWFKFGGVLCYRSGNVCETHGLAYRYINYELINSKGQVIKNGRGQTRLNWVALGYVNPASFDVGRLKVGTYQLKVSYDGNIKDEIAPVVKYVKVNVIK